MGDGMNALQNESETCLPDILELFSGYKFVIPVMLPEFSLLLGHLGSKVLQPKATV